jgi:2-dehydro-3-deoxygluconokinase
VAGEEVARPEVVTCGEAVLLMPAQVVRTPTDTAGLPMAAGRDRALAAFAHGTDSVHR